MRQGNPRAAGHGGDGVQAGRGLAGGWPGPALDRPAVALFAHSVSMELSCASFAVRGLLLTLGAGAVFPDRVEQFVASGA